MHEVSIAQEIIEIVKSYLPKNNHVSVKSVKVEVGEFSNILPEALSFGFEVRTENSELKGAELIISKIPLTVKCKDCGYISTLEEPFFFCNSCESANVEILTGTELNVIEIELND
ncbi:MAG: hydrogenase maturation nickel metallochaperone HypA [Ignavibacteria bacterium GWB2_35_12]|nr:MAG: hydrogenase maturation nickel metallochaperone HypA [Ignavibacteria bacterium GWA2_35_8]OGU39660.1 MAG: hydrogenase maturation nickel metallochaperone HypA [Ignavibacteria bacterium GWB2_35_12]OGU93580.1 MAG: hydrogenase maturation nickel metallochaperone HypA [Ignavibacteria bacterium RIFOXYA2_FULL_35_10]OGV23854.1 MAG: hydrogenase maturation nickel metallochaperone HypA [Ignavibacteria bacterium RIFOXYC2_FULL_35_21]